MTFAGFQLSSEGYKVDSSITTAVSQFPIPTSRTDLWSFCGLVNQPASGSVLIAEIMSLLRPLLSSKNEFIWSDHHSQAFAKVKEQLPSVSILGYQETYTDASRQGIDFVLQRQSTSGQWVLIQAGSRFLSSPESRYAIIELEILAVTWAVLKCKMFLEGGSNTSQS